MFGFPLGSHAPFPTSILSLSLRTVSALTAAVIISIVDEISTHKGVQESLAITQSPAGIIELLLTSLSVPELNRIRVVGWSC